MDYMISYGQLYIIEGFEKLKNKRNIRDSKTSGKKKNRKINRKIIILIITVILIITIFLMHCFAKRKKTEVHKEGLSQESLVIYEGHSKTIELYHKNSDMAVWNSSDESVITVSQAGEITAVKAGEAEVMVELDKKSYSCEVTVKEPISPIYYEKAKNEMEWILSQRLNNGLFANRVDGDSPIVIVNVYFSSEIANSLLQSGLGAENMIYIRQYLDWYFESMNTDRDYNGLVGTVYDYTEFLDDNGEVVDELPTEQYDSVDSYAAFFIITLYNYCINSGDAVYIKEHETEINLIVDVMLEMIKDNYCITKPDYPLKYLMDNSEVYGGLKCAETIYRYVLEDEERAKQSKEAYENMQKYFDELWWKENHYSTYLNEKNEDVSRFSWDTFYPDAVSQLYPIIYGLADAETSKEIYEQFCEHYHWEQLDYYLDGGVDYYWGVVAYVAVVMGDISRAQEYIEIYEKLTADREYPLIASDSAWVMMAEYTIAQYYEAVESCYY